MSVVVEIRDGVAILTLDRPDKRNAFTGEMGRQLSAAYRACDLDDAIRAVVLTGTPPAFCSGADVSAGQDTFAGTDESFSAGGVGFPAFRVRKPVIAAVNGHAIGIGLTLALQCDLRVMATEASYGVVQVRRGVLGDAWSHWTLPRIVGISRAAEILLVGGTFDGHRARELGLTDRVLPAEEVLPTALALAREVADRAAPLSVALSKQLLWSSFERDAASIVAGETEAHRLVMAHEDAREAMRALMTGDQPQWSGQVSDLS